MLFLRMINKPVMHRLLKGGVFLFRDWKLIAVCEDLPTLVFEIIRWFFVAFD